MKPSLLLIRLASWLAPQPMREDWRREWESEIRHARRTMEQRGEAPGAIRAHLVQFAGGAFHDAAWHRRSVWNRERLTKDTAQRAESAGFCLAALAAMVVFIALSSGFLPRTRAVLLPLPYRDPGRVATVSEAGTLATRTGIHTAAVSLWRSQSRLIDDAATYAWTGESPWTGEAGAARVSANFFYLLGARTSDGREFERNGLAGCRQCVVLSYDFWRRAGRRSTVLIGGRPYRVAGVLERGFWFLAPRIGVWEIDGAQGSAPPAGAQTRTGVVVRLRPDVQPSEAALELGTILRDSTAGAWDSFVDVSPVASIVRSVFGSFALALGLAMVVVVVSLRLRLTRAAGGCVFRRWAFFTAKTILLLAAVLLCGIEFTRASSLTMLGGTDISTEPISTWLFLMGSMGVLFWSISDQRRRCRVCLRRLGLATHVGCPGCLLLNWAGTELVCVEGHGMLHVPEMAACWTEPRQWTALDDSWQDLFERSS